MERQKLDGFVDTANPVRSLEDEFLRPGALEIIPLTPREAGLEQPALDKKRYFIEGRHFGVTQGDNLIQFDKEELHDAIVMFAKAAKRFGGK